MKVGFLQRDEEYKKPPLVKEEFTNAICYGQTGSGKTTGFILPNIENRIKLNHGILVYDFKGNLHEQVKYIAKKYGKLQDVYEIGKPWGEDIDILKYTTAKSLKSMFSSIYKKHNDSYWDISAFNLFENIYYLLKDMHEVVDLIQEFDSNSIKLDYEYIANSYYPSIQNIYTITKSAKSLQSFFTDINPSLDYMIRVVKKYLALKYYNDQKKQLITKIFNFIDRLEKRRGNLEEYHNIADNAQGASANSGNNGVLQVLSNILLSVANKECFSRDGFDIVENLLDGKIIIMSVGSFNDSMLNFLNFSIYNRLTMQTAIRTQREPVTIFIDEAQKVISKDSMPDVDICRENRFEFIMSTQDSVLLVKQIGEIETYLLLRNIISQYSFKTVEESFGAFKDTSKIKKFEYLDMAKNRVFQAKPIFISEDELFDTEYEYQKLKNVQNLVDIKNRSLYILRYKEVLYSEYKTLVCFKKGHLIETVNLTLNTQRLEDYILELKAEQKMELDEENLEENYNANRLFE